MMTRKLRTTLLLTLVSLASSATAVAHDSVTAKLAELDPLSGSWECEGTQTDPSGETKSSRWTLSTGRKYDNAWIVSEWTSVNADGSASRQGTYFSGYDAAQNKFTRRGFTGNSGYSSVTSEGWAKGIMGDTLEWMGEYSKNGVTWSMHEVVVMRGVDAFDRALLFTEGTKIIYRGESQCHRVAAR